MADEPMWRKVYRGEMRIEDIPPVDPASLEVCEVGKQRAQVGAAGRLGIAHDAARHGIGPDAAVPARHREPLAMPRRIGADRYSPFGEKP